MARNCCFNASTFKFIQQDVFPETRREGLNDKAAHRTSTGQDRILHTVKYCSPRKHSFVLENLQIDVLVEIENDKTKKIHCKDKKLCNNPSFPVLCFLLTGVQTFRKSASWSLSAFDLFFTKVVLYMAFNSFNKDS